MCNQDTHKATAPLLNAPAALASCTAFLDEQVPITPKQIHILTAPGFPLHTPCMTWVCTSVMRWAGQQLISASFLRGWGCGACLPTVSISLVGREMSPGGPGLSIHRPWRGQHAGKLDWEVHRFSYVLTSIPRPPRHEFGIFFFLLPDTLVTAAVKSQS